MACFGAGFVIGQQNAQAGASSEGKPTKTSANKPSTNKSLAKSGTKNNLHSFKGWELYSWKPAVSTKVNARFKQRSSFWHFSLLVGTNREKSLEEILDPKQQIVGVAALKTRLGQLAAGEFVGWSGHQFTQPKGKLSFPPLKVVQEIETFAKKRKLNFARPRSTPNLN